MGRDMTLGDRMKRFESQYSSLRLLDKIPVIARMDGRAFHTFTSGLKRPYDENLSTLMVETTRYLVEQTGAKLGYTQSDEISLVWHEPDFDSMLFFDGKLLKMTSVLASMTTAFFNRRLAGYLPSKSDKVPIFDARVYSVPNRDEAISYLIWRERDATRNSITMAAQSVYSHNELNGKKSEVKQQMLFEKGINWNDYPSAFKRGSYIQKRRVVRAFNPIELENLPLRHHARLNPDLTLERNDVYVLDMPPLTKVVNKEQVIFEGALPMEGKEFQAGVA